MKLKPLFPCYVVQYYSYHLNSATFPPHILEKMKISSMNHEFLNTNPQPLPLILQLRESVQELNELL